MNCLKRIEEKHSTESVSHMSLLHDYCPVCNKRGLPCDVVKLARALDNIRDGARWGMAHDQIVGKAERALEEVAGD